MLVYPLIEQEACQIWRGSTIFFYENLIRKIFWFHPELARILLHILGDEYHAKQFRRAASESHILKEESFMNIPFVNEPFTPFAVQANQEAFEDALRQVEAELGQEYPIIIGGQKITTAAR